MVLDSLGMRSSCRVLAAFHLVRLLFSLRLQSCLAALKLGKREGEPKHPRNTIASSIYPRYILFLDCLTQITFGLIIEICDIQNIFIYNK